MKRPTLNASATADDHEDLQAVISSFQQHLSSPVEAQHHAIPSSPFKEQFDSTKIHGVLHPNRQRRAYNPAGGLQESGSRRSSNPGASATLPTVSGVAAPNVVINSAENDDDDDTGAASTLGDDSFFAQNPRLLASAQAGGFGLDAAAFSRAVAGIVAARDTSQFIFTRRRELQKIAAERLRQDGAANGGNGPNLGRRGTVRRSISVRAGRNASQSQRDLAAMRRTTSGANLSRGTSSSNSRHSPSPKNGNAASPMTRSLSDTALFGPMMQVTTTLSASAVFEPEPDPLAQTMLSHGSSTTRPGGGGDAGGGGGGDAGDGGDADAPVGMVIRRFEDMMWRYSAAERIASKHMMQILVRRCNVTDRVRDIITDILALNEDDDETMQLKQKQPKQANALVLRGKGNRRTGDDGTAAKAHFDDSSDPDIEDSARRHIAEQKQRERATQRQQQPQGTTSSTDQQQLRRRSVIALVNQGASATAAAGAGADSAANAALGDAPELHVFVDASVKMLEVVSQLSDRPWLDLPRLPPKAVLDCAEFWRDLQRYTTEMSLCVHDSFWQRTHAKRARNELRAAREVAVILSCLAGVLQFRRHRVRAAAAGGDEVDKKLTAVAKKPAVVGAASDKSTKEEDGADENSGKVKGLPLLRFLLSTSAGIAVSEQAALQQLTELFPTVELDEDEARLRRERNAERKREQMMQQLEAQANGEAFLDDAAAASGGVEDEPSSSSVRMRRAQQAGAREGDGRQQRTKRNQNIDEEGSASPQMDRRRSKRKVRDAQQQAEALLNNLFATFNVQLQQLRVDEVAEQLAAFPGERHKSKALITTQRSSVFDIPALTDEFPREIHSPTYEHITSSSAVARRNAAVAANPLVQRGTIAPAAASLPLLKDFDREAGATLPLSSASPSSALPAIAASPAAVPKKSKKPHEDDDGVDFFLTGSAAPSPIGKLAGSNVNNARQVAVVEPRRRDVVASPSSVLALGPRQQQPQHVEKRRRHTLLLVPMTPSVSHLRQAEQLSQSRRRQAQERREHRDEAREMRHAGEQHEALLQSLREQRRPAALPARALTPGPAVTAPSVADLLERRRRQKAQAVLPDRALTPASYLAPRDLAPVAVPTGPFQQHVRAVSSCYEKASHPLGRALNCLSPGFEMPGAGHARALRTRLRQTNM